MKTRGCWRRCASSRAPSRRAPQDVPAPAPPLARPARRACGAAGDASRCRTRWSAPGRTTHSSRPASPTRRSRARIACRPRPALLPAFSATDAVSRQLRRHRHVNPERPVRVDRRRQHVPRVGGGAPGRCRPARSCGRRCTGARRRKRWPQAQARNRAARSRRHRHAQLLRAGRRAAQVRHRAAGSAAGARASSRSRSSRSGSARSRGATSSRRRSSIDSSSRHSGKRRWRWTTRGWRSRCCCFPTLDENFTVVDDLQRRAGAAAVCRRPNDGGARQSGSARGRRSAASGGAGRPRREERVPSEPRRRRHLRHRGERVRAAQPHRRAAGARRAAEPRLLRHGESVGARLGLGRLAEQAASERDARAPGAGDAEPDAAAAGEQSLLDVQRSAGGAERPSTTCGASRSSPPRACA